MDKLKKFLVFATIGILAVLIIACLVFASIVCTSYRKV